jgi:hypothetical protein
LSQNESEILHISFEEHPLPVMHAYTYAPLQWIGMGTYIFHKQCISMSRNVEAIWWTMWRMSTRPCICFIAKTISSILLLKIHRFTSFWLRFWYPHIFFTGDVHSIQHYGIKLANELWLVGDFLQALWFPPPIKLTPQFS